MMQTYYRVLGMPITPDVAQKITDGDIGIIWTATKGFLVRVDNASGAKDAGDTRAV